MKYIDLSHTIEDGLITYLGLPAPIICDYLSREESRRFYEDGTEFQIGRIDMIANTGTYLDCPFHRFEGGKDLAEITFEQFTDLEGVVVRMPSEASLTVSRKHLEQASLKGKAAVLVHTGWARYWGTDSYFENHPCLTQDAAEYLRDLGVKLVGIDSHNIDDTRTRSRPVHATLLGADILIVEHLCNLDAVPDDGFLFSAIPPKVKGMGTFPVRAMAKVPR